MFIQAMPSHFEKLQKSIGTPPYTNKTLGVHSTNPFTLKQGHCETSLVSHQNFDKVSSDSSEAQHRKLIVLRNKKGP